MPDPRFYRREGPRSLADLAAMTGTRPAPEADAGLLISDIAQLETAGAGDIVFVTDKEFVDAWRTSKASACVTTEALAKESPNGCAVLIATDPRAAFASIAAAYYPAGEASDYSAPIAPDAQIGQNARLAPGVVIGAKAIIGENVSIGANSVIGPGVEIGAGSAIGANVTVFYALVGRDVILHPGVRIGQDGFGFAPTPSGLKKVPQLGRVLIHDNVEIGANSTVDRGAVGDTVIGAGTKIDNLVQIGHNVVIGRRCIIVAQVGISGSCTLGDGVVLGGQVGLADHVEIADGAQVAAQSGLMRNVGRGEVVMGSPAKPIRQFWREVAALTRLTRRNKGP
ncbi:MAG: UDP-3-O-(3-hydroxymyristoyl)glucosamine N-acyltransferase [Rhodospirillaceae bacterium]